MSQFHTPVLVKEVLNYLNIKPGEKYIDATIGGGGHAQEILQQGGIVLGIDQDPQALNVAKKRLSKACLAPLVFRKRKRLNKQSAALRKNLWGPNQSLHLARGNFTNLETIAINHGFNSAAGILFDLGASSYQLTTKHRGFSFSQEAILDMRMDPDLAVTAKDLVNALGRKELYALFTKLAQEKRARPIAAAIIRARRQKPIETTTQLAQIINQVYKGRFIRRGERGKLHPATKVFQALRIAVNDELNNLKTALPQTLKLLQPQGRLIIISFHQGEDKIVKDFFKQQSSQGKLTILTKKPIIPSSEEINLNPRSRSAKLRAAAKAKLYD